MIKYISTKEAFHMIENSWMKERYTPNLPTLIAWIKKYNLGFKFTGRWHIDKIKMENFIKEEKIPNGNTKKKK